MIFSIENLHNSHEERGGSDPFSPREKGRMRANGKITLSDKVFTSNITRPHLNPLPQGEEVCGFGDDFFHLKYLRKAGRISKESRNAGFLGGSSPPQLDANPKRQRRSLNPTVKDRKTKERIRSKTRRGEKPGRISYPPNEAGSLTSPLFSAT